jgi:hypothetical protein
MNLSDLGSYNFKAVKSSDPNIPLIILKDIRDHIIILD